ncbi:ATP synthase F1 subunit epsilon [Cytophagaceae bacterium ABcell3]|nr:ATP synthase F1 subunit epsilon [Cytophagaceae bacterium ABcell3]
MHLEIITPDNKVFSGEVISANFPGSKGAFEVKTNHAPLISTLNKGDIVIQEKDLPAKSFTVDGGIIEVLNNNIIVLAESVAA